MTPSIHASAVLVGPRAVLIRGPSGAGKSQLALRLLSEPPTAALAQLIGDDRVHLEAVNGRLLVRSAPALEGLLEVRGVGLTRWPFEPLAVVGLVVDLGADDAERLPDPAAGLTTIEGIAVPRLAVAHGCDPLPVVRAALRATAIYRDAAYR